jgi:hypothetical protein
MIGKTPLVSYMDDNRTKVNWWFTQIYSRGMAMTALHTGDPKALELCKTLAVGSEGQAGYMCTLYAVLYHLTGEQKYKDVLLRKTDGGRTLLELCTSGDYPATAHWLLMQPPRKN